MSDVDPSRLVFVGGLHRSGTTPFSRVLAQHPDVSGLSETSVREDEGQHLQRVYPRAKEYGGSGRFAHSPQAHLTEASALVSAENARAMTEAWAPYWDLRAPLLLEKSPPNMLMGRFLQACFPGSALIVVVRHPVTVALSTKKWRRLASSDPRKFESLSSLVDHWVVAHEILAGDLPVLQRVLVVHYERLVAEPALELERVRSFLGLTEPLPGTSFSASHGSSYEQWWDALRSPLRPGGWQRRIIERVYGERLTHFGYDTNDLSLQHDVSGDPHGLLVP